MGVENISRTDTRTETTDNPTPQERPSTPPPDNPGSPGQPSRLESLARAREQQERRAQELRNQDAGSPAREERDDKPTSGQDDNEAKEANSGNPAAEEKGLRNDRADTERPEERDERDREPSLSEEGSTDRGKPDTDPPHERERPQTKADEKRSEPTDDPVSSEQRGTPPSDNPGSPSQPSRLESLARAREQQERRAQETTRGVGSTPESGPGTDTPADRGQPQARTAEQRAETTDGPAPSGRQWTPPPDNPGSPGRPSRLESLARAREQQQAAAAQRNELGNGRERNAEQNTSPADGSENTADKPQTPAEPPTAGQERDSGRSEPAETRHSSGGGEQPVRFDNGTRTGDHRVNGDRGEPVEQAPGASHDTRTADTGEPVIVGDEADSADDPTDRKLDTSQPDTDTGLQDRAAGDNRTSDDAPASPERADPAAETREPHGEQDRDHGRNPEDGDNPQPRNETNETDQNRPTNPILLDARFDGEGRIQFEPRYRTEADPDTEYRFGEAEGPGTELARHEDNTDEVEEERRFAGRIQIALDSDGRPILPSRDTENETPDRGEPRHPEDDPLERDINESGRRRWETCEASINAFDAAREVAKKMDELVSKPNPTGKAEVRPPHAIDNLQQHPNSPDIATSVFILALFTGYAAKHLGNAYQQRRTG